MRKVENFNFNFRKSLLSKKHDSVSIALCCYVTFFYTRLIVVSGSRDIYEKWASQITNYSIQKV